MRGIKTAAGRCIQEKTLEFFTRGKGNGMNNAIETIPVFAEFSKGIVNLAIFRNITGNDDG